MRFPKVDVEDVLEKGAIFIIGAITFTLLLLGDGLYLAAKKTYHLVHPHG